MDVVRQTKAENVSFLQALMKERQVFAPVKKDAVRFVPLKKEEDIEEIYLEENSYTPVKSLFFSQEETLFKFKKLTGKVELEVPKIKNEPRAIFGLRKCDLNAIKHQDKVFMEDTDDPYYKARRKNTLLLGYHCHEAPSKYCFCGTLNLVDFFDLMFYDYDDHYLIEIGSEQGKEVVKRFKKFFTPHNRKLTQEEKKIRGADRLPDPDISDIYDDEGWQEGVNLCLSCAACTSLCPTCYCYEMHDSVESKDPDEGKRVRNWSSCQLQSFTRVAGDHVFRKEREHRFKHRIYHQLEYFKERYGVNMCTGCGRCISGCPTRIDFVDMINKMKAKKNGKTENNSQEA
jgi:sulfhydrogenase subunit beta (sulfur reductase)